MREPLKDKNRLEHIISAIDVILNRSESITFEELTSDKMLYGGFVYHTMIIGEAAYMLSKDFKEAHPATPWRQIEGMRHHIVHGYYQVREDMLWNVIRHDLQPLRQQILKYLEEMNMN